MPLSAVEGSPDYTNISPEASKDAKIAKAALSGANLSVAVAKKLTEMKNIVKTNSLLDNAKNIINYKPKLTYGLGAGQFECDTFIKYLFSQTGDESLKGLYGAPALYTYFNPPKENIITSTSRYAFNTGSKYPSSGDLLFFTDANNACGHVAMFSRVDATTGNMYVYDATPTNGVSERQLWPNELIAPYNYRNIYYTSPTSV